MGGANVVIHAAYYRENGAFINGGLSNRKKFLKLNLLGSHDLLEESKEANVKQFIFMSSCAVFGAVDPVLPLDEKHPLQPDSLYGAYKASVESLCHAYFFGEGLETVIFRPVAIYGKHPQLEKCRWRTIVDDIKNGKDVNVTGGGKIVCADDIVQAVTRVLGNKSVAGNIYALSDLFISEIEIAEITKNLSGSKSKITGARKVQKNVMVNDKAKRLGVNFREKEGLRDYIKDILEQ